MKVLVATAWTQGARDDDFNHCVEGELVWIGIVCDRDLREFVGKSVSSGGCGCGRAFAGTNSHRATTTARVADVDMSREDYVDALGASLDSGGWNPLAASALADELLDIADDFALHSVMERTPEAVRCRGYVSVQ